MAGDELERDRTNNEHSDAPVGKNASASVLRPEVTIITPIFNAEEFLCDSVNSVLAQTHRNWELILVDDCSFDSSFEIAENFCRADSRIRCCRLEHNSGAAVARNVGIELAQGRYIAFLDSDDMWMRDKLEKQIDFMRSFGYAFTYTWYECITEHAELTGRILRPAAKVSYKELLKSNRIGCLTAVYDTERLGKCYMPLIRKRQDYGLWLKILRREKEAHCLQEPLALYRIRKTSISSNKIEMLKYHWDLYRHEEKLSVVSAAYYLCWHVINRVMK